MAVGGDAGTPVGKPAAPKTGWGVHLLWVGGIVAGIVGIATASCCVVPFAMFLAAISGAWIGNLTALEPYRLYFAGFGVACIGLESYLVYRKPATTCTEDSYCARPVSRRIAKIGLWTATTIVAVAIAWPYLIARWL